jgi:hypothetical protein
MYTPAADTLLLLAIDLYVSAYYVVYFLLLKQNDGSAGCTGSRGSGIAVGPVSLHCA